MFQLFKEFIGKNDLFGPADKILLAVSAGMDSVALVELFHKAGYNFALAHCNFCLRGDESDEDELFVRKLAEQYDVPLFIKQFNTSSYARAKGISIQMAARELRYQWFEELIKITGYYCYATGHHLDDDVETFFVNLTRGTGISGLTGISPKKGHLVRPLLFAYRQDIENYIRENKLSYREDSSNLEEKYMRNKLRRKVMPLFKQLNPSFNIDIIQTINRLKETETIFRCAIDEKRRSLIKYESDRVKIPIEEILLLTPVRTYLYEFLSPYSFNAAIVNKIIETLEDQPGKIFYSATHQLVLDRKYLIITRIEKDKENKESYLINADTTEIYEPVHLKLSFLPAEEFRIRDRTDLAYLDNEKLTFPLMIRKWKKGDYFYPLGMKGKKKISDFLIDNKVPLTDKKNIWLLCSGEDIAWVVGHRIDDRYKITPLTREIYFLELLLLF
jgi:tRNA(Ile)-lysidine synthase